MAFTQTDRPLRVSTPLGADKLLITRLSGTEVISELFHFQLELLAENATKVEFDKLIGQGILIELELPEGKTRFFSGICSRLSEGRRDEDFTRYRMEIVPVLWLLTRRTQCRIFQQKTVPEILKEALAGIDTAWELHGTYDPRDYCVQYRETDFAFVSRLMEEEGIYFYFKHTSKGHQLVVADTPAGHADVPVIAKALFDDSRGGNRPDMRVTEWEKSQELRSGKVTLWDHCFELPGKTLETQKTTPDSVAIGKVTHKLKLAGNDALELYDYPGAYAQRYDGIDPGGGDRAGDLQKIFKDNDRTAKIRMEQEATEAVELRGSSDCRQFTAGHKFSLERHFNADGSYVLLRVVHDARVAANYRSGQGEVVEYSNQFTCLPHALPYRSPFRTPEPMIQGPQTATVVGPPGELISCDKYGRVKVQFHWDRHGKKDAASSCWVRVSQNWGGAGWGGMFIPHLGQEVIVEFEEGDPDRPLITGRVYNAESMPPLELPANKTKSAIRDHGGNEIILEGHDGVQQMKMLSPHFRTILTLGAARNPPEGFSIDTDHHAHFIIKKDVNWDVDGKHDEDIVGDETIRVHGSHSHTTTLGSTERVLIGKELSIGGAYITQVGGMMNELVVASRTEETGGWRSELTGLKKTERVLGSSSLTVGRAYTIGVGRAIGITAANQIAVEAKSEKLVLKCGGSSIELNHDGTITIHGNMININADNDIKGVAKADLILQGAAFDLSSKNGEGKVTAKTDLNVGSDMMTLTAKNDLTAKGGADLLLQGAAFVLKSSAGTGEVNGKSTLDIKGGVVKINC